jgi:tripartite ATP-independent transporter DctM subunit
VETATVNALILFIIIGATFYTYVVGSTNVAQHLHAFVDSASISPWQVIVIINIILIILGCIIDPITITLLTIPIFVPLIVKLGMDPIWFGVVFTVNTQIGLITPPMGIDLFAVRTVFNVPTGDLLRGVMPFLLSEIIFLALISAFPQISLWLPNMMIVR